MTPKEGAAWLAFIGAVLMAWPALRSVLILRKIPEHLSQSLEQTDTKPANGTDTSPKPANWNTTKRRMVKRSERLAQSWHGYLFWMFIVGLLCSLLSSFISLVFEVKH